MRGPYSCSICGETGHTSRDHDASARSRSLMAGRLVYEEGLSFAEAGRRIGISRQAAHQGWRRYVRQRDLHRT
jgi:predicted DNA-binding protein (UPF0251 family)